MVQQAARFRAVLERGQIGGTDQQFPVAHFRLEYDAQTVSPLNVVDRVHNRAMVPIVPIAPFQSVWVSPVIWCGSPMGAGAVLSMRRVSWWCPSPRIRRNMKLLRRGLAGRERPSVQGLGQHRQTVAADGTTVEARLE